tara:strand:+ start:256667 stop:257638 length:972 start_codon:yes stop_codon:yes gene_type:complete
VSHVVSIDNNESNPAAGASSAIVCEAVDLHHKYGDHIALRGVGLQIHPGEIVALLGPNGSGKTTLFRLLCTLMPIQQGSVRIGGIESRENPLAIRQRIGIVFQSPSLDKKLTVDENIACQGALYGITGKRLQARRDELLQRFGLTDRRSDFCESLSGGLKRRVEIAKGMLHRPQLLLLDEPSTGLDPSARLEMYHELRSMAADGTSIVITTHLLDEAEKADRVMILNQGELIAEGSPGRLRSEMGGGFVTVVAIDNAHAEGVLRNELGLDPQSTENEIRIQHDSPAELVPAIAAALGANAQSISVGRPSLEDVFISKTGHRFH